MGASISEYLNYRRLFSQTIITIFSLVFFSVAPSASAQSGHEQVEGVKNFGRVTDRYFRGGAVTPDGIKTLAEMGVRVIIDLRDEPNADEPDVCQRNGVKYFNFPMTGHDVPGDKVVNEILSIIQSAKEPVYVHCSAGKHRAGTIAALYRMRVQGWSKDQAWAEQQSYGFGMPEEHPELYAYAYGSRADRAASTAHSTSEGKGRREKKDKKKDKTKTIAGPKADDEAPAVSVANAPARATAGLSAEANYITMAEAVERAKAEGGSGDVLKVDLEWDATRSVATWDVTFSSGAEYEIDAATGKVLGTKPKAPAKLAALSPLELEKDGRLTFQEIIRKTETSRAQTVIEMELKRIKGRTETVYEVVLADGVTLLYNAATGDMINGVQRD
jgi:uncharacterized membrane protein YkoI/protein tyrosine phosphatase (PTP) superfamily phosphohydrolase (DUF442 family)